MRILIALFLSILTLSGYTQQEHSHHTSETCQCSGKKSEMTMPKMQGGSAPEDARDPHSYSDGHTLETGPYTIPGPRLKLADQKNAWGVLGERFEYDWTHQSGTYDIMAWYGRPYNRFMIHSEGEIEESSLAESHTSLLYSHAYSSYFDWQAGLRFDQHHEGVDRTWLALGVQGLAPYWFELDAQALFGDQGRIAAAFEAEYELLLTQRLILQPRAELNWHAEDDIENHIRSGLTKGSLGLRLRYEFSRQFAPYIGVEWSSQLGQTRNLYQGLGWDTNQTKLVTGIRFWF